MQDVTEDVVRILDKQYGEGVLEAMADNGNGDTDTDDEYDDVMTLLIILCHSLTPYAGIH